MINRDPPDVIIMERPEDVRPDWPRVRIPIPPCGPGRSLEETEQALLAVCQAMWETKRIPVVGWGCEDDGTELHPPVTH